MANANLELKQQADNEAANRTQIETDRILSYRTLRYGYSSHTVDEYYDFIFEEYKEKYKPLRNPSSNKARKESGISLKEWFWNLFDKHSRQKMKETILVTKRKLQEEVEAFNRQELARCNRLNAELLEKIGTNKKLLINGDREEIEEYFQYVIERDEYSLSPNYCWKSNFCLKYIKANKRLVIDYQFPRITDIPDTKYWAVNRNLDVVSKPFTKTEYLDIYERIIFDLTIRVIGLIYDSDNYSTIKEIVFNGSCVYDTNPEVPIFILSTLCKKKQFMALNSRRADFDSKSIVSNKFLNTVYIGKLKGKTAQTILLEDPPLKQIKPIQSNLIE